MAFVTLVLIHAQAVAAEANVAAAPAAAAPNAAVATDANFACGGSVEAEVWDAWDGNVRDYLRQSLLDARLLKQGDVYALYDIQTYTHNMASMVSRCNKTNSYNFPQILDSPLSLVSL